MVGELTKLVAEICGVVAVCGGVVVGLRRQRRCQIETLPALAGVLAVLTTIAVLVNLLPAGAALDHAQQAGASSRAAAEHCFEETGGRPGPRRLLRLVFVDWVKQRLPAHSSYELAPYAGPPDPWCVALVLLPMLPARAGEHAQWTLTFGTLPADLQARIARHDPSVQTFAPGFAVARGGNP